MADVYDLFVSYKQSDGCGRFVREVLAPMLRRWLGEQGLSVYLDMHDERGGDLRARITTALLSSRCMLSVWTPLYFPSRWCWMEWQTFRSRERTLGMLDPGYSGPALVYPLMIHPPTPVLPFPNDAANTPWDDRLRTFTALRSCHERTELWLSCEQAVQALVPRLARCIAQAPPPDLEFPIDTSQPAPGPTSASLRCSGMVSAPHRHEPASPRSHRLQPQQGGHMTTGTVVTFYSYKGGVGRTFLLANAAVLLARWGFRVLCVDFDLEAPGLTHYFTPPLVDAPHRGLVQLLAALADGAAGSDVPDWQSAKRHVKIEGTFDRLHVLGAGRGGDDYARLLRDLDWDALYEKHDFGRVLESWRSHWTHHFDFVLVDSRTGLTDSQGVCTVQLPDVLVVVFTCNEQSLAGVVEVATRAIDQRRQLPLDRPGPLVLPVPSRYDATEFPSRAEEWTRTFERRLDPFYAGWRHPEVTNRQMLEKVRVKYASFWSFGEDLAVERESGTDASQVSYDIATVAGLLAHGLGGSDRLATARDAYVQEAIDRNRALLGPGPRSFSAEVYLSTAMSDPLAQPLRAELGRRMTVASEAITGSRLGDLEAALERCRHLAWLQPRRDAPGTWQRMELLAFQQAANSDPDRRLVIVAQDPDSLPGDLSTSQIQRIDARALSPARVADAVVAALQTSRPEPRVGTPPAAPVEPGAAWRAWVRSAHSNLIPFFRGGGDMLLSQVFVDLEVAPEPERLEAGKRGQPAPGDLDSCGRASTLQALVENAPNWVVLGEPGSGKTTLVRHLAWTLARQPEGPVPVVLSLARHGGDLPNPLDAAAHEPRAAGETLSPADARAVLAEAAARPGGLWLFLDGLDEVDPARMEAVRDWLRGLPATLPHAHIVVTSRPVALEHGGLGRSFARARVLPLDAERQRKLLGHLLGATEAGALWAELERRPALADLGRNPLLLTLVAIVGREAGASGARLPSRRVRLYRETIDLLLRRGYCPEPRGVRDRVVARAVLRELSHDLHAGGGETWTREVLHDTVFALTERDETLGRKLRASWDRGIDDFLEDIGHNSGVIGPHDGPGAPWRYLHRSLREYLAAESLQSRGDAAVDAWVKRWSEALEGAGRPRTPEDGEREDPARWGEVHALLCGLVDDPMPLLRHLRDGSPDLARRAVVTMEGLPPADGMDLLLGTAGWEVDDLAALARGWSLPAEERAEALWRRVGPDAPVAELAAVWHLLAEAGEPPDRERFFAGRKGFPPRDLPETVELPAGSFWMGSKKGGANDGRPLHRVTITQPFRLGRSPVTAAEYRAFDRSPGKGERLPAVNVSWYEARLFAAWLGGRLPTEAEWEYACRAGTGTAYWSGNTEADLARVGWYTANSDSKLHPVGEKPPSPWGLYDMHGNVWEWCADWLGPYPADDVADPVGPPSGELRVLRGGSYWVDTDNARSAYRYGNRPGGRDWDFGFRVVLPLLPPPNPRRRLRWDLQ